MKKSQLNPKLESGQLLSQIEHIIATHPDMLWMSEDDRPITAVVLGWWEVHTWAREDDQYEQDMLDMSNSDNEGLKELATLMLKQDRLIAIHKKARLQSNYDLFILARFGVRYYVGFKTRLIET